MDGDHSKMSAKEAREHLRELRKEHVKPVSRMGKRDVLEEIERLKVRREEIPPVAATPAAPSKKMNPMVESIKDAKRMEFPSAPEEKSDDKSGKTKKGDARKTARKAYIPPTKSEVKHEEDMLKHKEEKAKKKSEPKKSEPKKSESKKSEKKDEKSEKPAKGSEAMKAKMAMIRAMKKKRDDKK